jgi:DnaJ family protein C protein 13
VHTLSTAPGTLKGNWDAFWGAVQRDHSHAALVWNEGTRAELREALQAEEAALRLARLRGVDAAPENAARDGGGGSGGSTAAGGGVGGSVVGSGSGSGSGSSLCWNHAEFRVSYPSLCKHLCIGGIYLRLLLDPPPSPNNSSTGGGGTSVAERLPAPRDFFSAAHHRLLCLGDAFLLATPAMAAAGGMSGGMGSSGGRTADAEADRELCVRAMTAVYHFHAGPKPACMHGCIHAGAGPGSA